MGVGPGVTSPQIPCSTPLCLWESTVLHSAEWGLSLEEGVRVEPHTGTPQDSSNEPPAPAHEEPAPTSRLPFPTPGGFWELQPLRQLTWVLFQSLLAGWRGQRGQRCHSSDSQKSKTAGRGFLRAADTHTDPGGEAVSEGCRRGRAVAEGGDDGAEEGRTHVGAPVPGRPTLLAAACGHLSVSQAVGIDPDGAHLEPVGREGDGSKSGRWRGAWSQGGGAGRTPERGDRDLKTEKKKQKLGAPQQAAPCGPHRCRLTPSPAPGPALVSRSTHWHWLLGASRWPQPGPP